MTPGVPRTDHHWVGERFRIRGGIGAPAKYAMTLGVCVSVTPWGNDRIRWVRLLRHDGTLCSYAPSHLQRKEN